MSSLRAFVAMVLRHLARDRSALFFMLVLPVAIIVIIGSTFGGQTRVRVGVVVEDRSDAARELVAELGEAPGIEIREIADRDELTVRLRRFAVAAGVVVPDGYGDRVAAGRTAELEVVGDLTSLQAVAARAAVERSTAGLGGRIAAARLVTAETGRPIEEARAAVDRADGAAVEVGVRDVGEAVIGDRSRFSLTAPQNLVLFVFINTLGAGALLVRSRQVGVLRRVLATPTPAWRVVAGLGAGWMAVALVQSVIIVAVGAVAFGVVWGDPLAAAVLVVAFALVGTGGGLLLGAVGRNEDRVGAVTPVVGLVLGALGGCMTPIEVFPPALVQVAHAIPHFWALRAWRTLIFDGGGLADIAPSLGILVGVAVVLGGSAVAVLRRDLTGG